MPALQGNAAAPLPVAGRALHVVEGGGSSRQDAIDDLLSGVEHAEDHLRVLRGFRDLGRDVLVRSVEVYHPWRPTPMYSAGNAVDVVLRQRLDIAQQADLLLRYGLQARPNNHGGPHVVREGKTSYTVAFFSV